MILDKCSYCKKQILPTDMKKTFRNKVYHISCFRIAKKQGLKDQELQLGYC